MPPAVGNDVVDLAETAHRTQEQRDRFISRVCSDREKRQLRDSNADVDLMLWYIWSGKETAYKVVQRQHQSLPFVHREFDVDLQSQCVKFQERRLVVRWTQRGNCLVCTGYSGRDRKPMYIVTDVAIVECMGDVRQEKMTGAELESAKAPASLAARILAKQMIARGLAWNWCDFEVLRHPCPVSFSGLTPPEIWHEGKKCQNLGISLAHHGRYVVCALNSTIPFETLSKWRSQPLQPGAKSTLTMGFIC